MDFINLLGSVWPDGNFWSSIIRLFDVGSYAWTIILFTIVLKLVLSPIDFAQRYFTNKQTRAQAKLQPELEKLKKRYGQNQTLLYQKQNELYQKNNVKPTGSCIVMLVYLGITLAVFLTLWSSLQSIAGFKIKNQYQELQTVYYNSFEKSYYQGYLKDYFDIDIEDLDAFHNLTKEERQQAIENAEGKKSNEIYLSNEVQDNPNLDSDDAKKEYANKVVEDNKKALQELAQIEVANYYPKIKDSFLWIKNIWRPDKATVSEIASYNDYKASAGDSSVSESEYNLVMAKLLNNYNNSNQTNGYYVLSVLVVAVSLLSQLVVRWSSKPKNKNGEKVVMKQPGFTKVLMFIMPITMLIFTLTSSSIFAIYIITNSVMTTLVTPLSTLICNKIEDSKEKKHKDEIKVDYRR